MKCIMVMFDTLNRRMLPPYGCDWTFAPNFRRLAERTVTFDNSYAGSLPCMPARRELHTGRYNFLHRSWGPIEPYDDSMPEMLHRAGIHSHLTTDHYHYFQDGGATYHDRYKTWTFHRGQEGDKWIGDAGMPRQMVDGIGDTRGGMFPQDRVNRRFMRREQDQPQPRTFGDGLDFMRRNADQDSWFLHLETFDPHEPYFSQRKYKDLYAEHYRNYRGPVFDWPPYRQVQESPEVVEHARYEYAALLSMCDAYLGEVLDLMDELQLWDDTMLIVNTDHGFLMGEHDWWAKVVQPFYNEVAHTPLFIWDPRCGCRGERRQSLVQTIDLPATILEYFGLARPEHMQGVPLGPTVAQDSPVREAGIFGCHGAHVNVTDGRYVYMRGVVDRHAQGQLYNYTVMPTHMTSMFHLDELRTATLHEGFGFTKGCPVLRVDANPWFNTANFDTMLFDLEADPQQLAPIRDAAVEKRLVELLRAQLAANDAPPEQYTRLGL